MSRQPDWLDYVGASRKRFIQDVGGFHQRTDISVGELTARVLWTNIILCALWMSCQLWGQLGTARMLNDDLVVGKTLLKHSVGFLCTATSPTGNQKTVSLTTHLIVNHG